MSRQTLRVLCPGVAICRPHSDDSHHSLSLMTSGSPSPTAALCAEMLTQEDSPGPSAPPWLWDSPPEAEACKKGRLSQTPRPQGLGHDSASGSGAEVRVLRGVYRSAGKGHPKKRDDRVCLWKRRASSYTERP